MSDRRAPKSGYDNPVKGAWRSDTWSAMKWSFGGDTRDKVSLLMPSTEGFEIHVAEANGFLRANMHVVDMNPAIAATISRTFPGIRRAHGRRVGGAFEAIAAAGGRIDACSLDFTSCMSVPLLADVRTIARSGVLAPTCTVAINLLRGREGGAARFLVRSRPDVPAAWRRAVDVASNAALGANDLWRLLLVASSLGDVVVTPRAVGTYAANKSSMVWGVFSLRSIGHLYKAAYGYLAPTEATLRLGRAQLRKAHRRAEEARSMIIERFELLNQCFDALQQHVPEDETDRLLCTLLNDCADGMESIAGQAATTRERLEGLTAAARQLASA